MLRYLMSAVIVLFSLAPQTEASPATAARVEVADFVGSYRLTATKYGMCDRDLQVWIDAYTGGSDLRVGSYYFPKINEGSWTWENLFEFGESITTLTSDGALTFATSFFDKQSSTNGSRTERAVLNKGRRTLWISSVHEGRIPITTECLYSRE